MLAPLLLGIAILAQVPASETARDYPPGDVKVRELEEGLGRTREALHQVKTAPGTAAAIRGLLWLERVDEGLDALLHLVRTEPRAVPDALPGLNQSRRLGDDVGDYSAKLAAVAAAAHAQAARLPREDAAALEVALTRWDVDGRAGLVTTPYLDRLRTVVERFAGTRAATMAEIERLGPKRRLHTLDAIVRAHPGTDIAAAALFAKGQEPILDSNAGPAVRPDPIDRVRLRWP